MMRQLIVLLLFPLFMSAQAELADTSDAQWLTDYETALKVAETNDKNVLVYFTGSDWCPPCKMLKKDLFESDAFLAVADDYVLLYIDIPMNRDLITPEQLQHNKALSAKLNKRGSVPLLKILDNKGKELDMYSGYSMNGETAYHMKLINKYRPS